jgi:hypothetical protein
MSPTELKMQPTIHFRKKLDIFISIASFFRKCIVGCIFNSAGHITTREIPCILKYFSAQLPFLQQKFFCCVIIKDRNRRFYLLNSPQKDLKSTVFKLPLSWQTTELL